MTDPRRLGDAAGSDPPATKRRRGETCQSGEPMTASAGSGGVLASRRALLQAVPLLLSGLALGRAWAPTPAAGADGAIAPAAGRTGMRPAFPLAVVPGKRYLIDAAGEPFLLHGDAAWSAIAQLTREDVDRYLEDRRARGFNTLLVELIEARYATNAPANAYGELPFHGSLFETLTSIADLLSPRPANYATRIASSFVDFGSPNEAYFVHADWVLRRAAEQGFLVLLAPSYLGWGGGPDGWYRAMVASGVDQMRAFGEYLGKRYRDFDNIMWVHAGDYDPPEKDLVSALAEGIKTYDSRALHTVHGAPETAILDYWSDAPWLEVNNIYTYGAVHQAALEQYKRPDPLPFFLIESAYENEHATTEQRIRTQAYQAILCGAAGQIFGNNPVWHFDAGGGFPAPTTWREALGSRGAQSMSHLRDLLTGLRWWDLEPDIGNALLIEGHGPPDDRAVAARAADRSFALLYLPTRREIAVDLAQLAGPAVAARWYDPADGRFSDVGEAPLSAARPYRFRPEPFTNSAGYDDWVLLLEAHS